MKTNLKKKLEPYMINDDEYLKAQGKLLKSILYPEDEDSELGNNAEPIKDYPDDPDDNYDEDYDSKDLFLDEFQRGEH